jgi:hypothetical protein
MQTYFYILPVTVTREYLQSQKIPDCQYLSCEDEDMAVARWSDATSAVVLKELLARPDVTVLPDWEGGQPIGQAALSRLSWLTSAPYNLSVTASDTTLTLAQKIATVYRGFADGLSEASSGSYGGAGNGGTGGGYPPSTPSDRSTASPSSFWTSLRKWFADTWAFLQRIS